MSILDRRYFLSSAATLPLIGSATGPILSPAKADPVIDLVREYFKANAAWCALSEFPEHGNGDTPEFLAAQDEVNAICHDICETEPTTPAGAVAVLEWLYEDSAGLKVLCDEHADALHNAITVFIAEYPQFRPLKPRDYKDADENP